MSALHWLMLLGAIVLVLGIAFWDRLYVKYRQYIALPWRKRHDTVLMRRRRSPIDLTQLPPELAVVFHGVARELAAAGFQAVGHFSDEGGLSGMKSHGWVSVWAAPDRVTTAQVIGVQVQMPGRPMRTETTFVFRTAFPEQGDIATSNSRTPGIFIPEPRVDGVSWAGMRDFNLLWHLHQARLARRTDNNQPASPPASIEEAEKYLDEINNRVMGTQVNGGYFIADPAAGVYRRTLRGSFFMTWHLLWPWKQFRARSRARKLARVLAEVGMGRPEDYLLIPPTAPHEKQLAAAARPLYWWNDHSKKLASP